MLPDLAGGRVFTRIRGWSVRWVRSPRGGLEGRDLGRAEREAWRPKRQGCRSVFVATSHSELGLKQEFKSKQVEIMTRHGHTFSPHTQ